MSTRSLSRRAFLTSAGLMPALGWQSSRHLELPYRHIHLDFHTSPAITGVAEDFKAEEFTRVLKEAAVNSITVFAKCHQGMAYYPTRVGVGHPHLKIDLLGEMVEACHRAGIRVPVYISTMYDQHAWRQHGDWRVLNPSGRVEGYEGPPGSPMPYLGRVCLNTGYLDYLAAQADEVLRLYEADGIFYDNMAYSGSGCSCAACSLEREKLGLDEAEGRSRHYQMVIDRAMERLAAIARTRRPKGSVDFNGPFTYREDAALLRRRARTYTHLEFECLAGKSGYDYFRVLSRYYRNFGLPAIGMTGIFHKTWGDFGTVRTQAALDFECFGMLAQGLRCSIGDHLHPAGRLNRAVYERIGRTFRSVAQKEPWCRGAKPVTEIGVLMNIRQQRGGDSITGATQMLEQLHQQFDIIDPLSDLARFRVVIAPDSLRLDATLQGKLEAYLKGGGKLILSDESGLDPEGKKFVLPVGLEYQGRWRHEAQYIEAIGTLAGELPQMVEMAYENGSAVKAAGAEVLAHVWAPYFNRNSRQFQVAQTPFAKATDFAAVARLDGAVYIATPVFRTYARHGYPFYRDLVGCCLRQLMDKPLVTAQLPTTALLTVTEQPSRRIVHILSYVAERRAPGVDIVEDVIPLYKVPLALRMERAPQRVYTAPDSRTVSFTYTEGYARVEVPRVDGHQLVVFE